MSEMAERAGRRVCETRRGYQPGMCGFKEIASYDGTEKLRTCPCGQWGENIAIARAAIAAMREPTEAMIEHANNTVRADSDNMQCPDWYGAAVDGALKPAEASPNTPAHAP